MMRLLKGIYHFILAWTGSVVYGNPSRELVVIGVTGTKGKSTTLEILNALFEASGKKTALLSSIRKKIGGESTKRSGNTMPGRFAIQRFLRQAVNAGCAYALIEVTSEGVVQHRHRFIAWDAAVFLNLHPEHIESHGSYERYRQAKVDFFWYVSHRSPKAPLFFINRSDKEHKYFERVVDQQERVTYFDGESVTQMVSPWLATEFNRENAAAAIAIARALDISDSVIAGVLHSFAGVSGRMEDIQREPFAVVIDYAHTPQSLIKVYQTLRNPNDKARMPKRLICVLGSAGGGRDTWKRAELGRIAGEYCDEIIITDEDPYDEKPEAIIDEIAEGASQITKSKIQNPKVLKIINRKEAIKTAIIDARLGDTVIITGKGSESWIHGSRGEKTPWDEKKVVEGILKK